MKMLLHEIPSTGETFLGETVTSVQSMGRKIVVFTPTKTYLVVRRPWYERLWEKIWPVTSEQK